jgi:anti-sigma B factor antagonist
MNEIDNPVQHRDNTGVTYEPGILYPQEKPFMPLSITSRPDRNFQVLTVTGHLTLGPSLRSLQESARIALETGAPEGLILDVSGIRYADSAGLGELTIVYSLCNRKQCALMLAGVPNQLRQMLELTRLDALLPSAPDIDSAKRQAKSHIQKLRGHHDSSDAAAGE